VQRDCRENGGAQRPRGRKPRAASMSQQHMRRTRCNVSVSRRSTNARKHGSLPRASDKP
jgi:hypothetical protein